MLTFQILDGGETYFHPLDRRSLTVGSAEASNIRLAERGVAEVHATVETAGSDCRIEVADGLEMLVNGVPVAAASLVLGDRVELGKAVLVLGEQRKRPATAGDVLTPVSVRSDRREPFAQGRSASMKRLLVLVLLLGAAGAFGLWKWGSSEADTHLPYTEREALVRARKQGRFDDADKRLLRLEADWAGAVATRISRTKLHRAMLDDTRLAFEALHQRFMAKVLDETEREQVNQLKLLRSGGTRAEREASVILMSGIRDFRMAAEDLAIADRKAAAPGATGDASTPVPVAAARPQVKPDWLDQRVAEVRESLRQRNYVHAIELARVTLPEVPARFADELLEAMGEVRRDARAEMHQLVTKAYALRQAGKLAAAVEMLQGEAMRFPGEGNLSYLYRELGQLSAELGVPQLSAPPLRPVVSKPQPAVVAKTNSPAVPARLDGMGPVAEDVSSDRPSGRLDKRLIARVLRDVDQAERDGDLGRALRLLDESIKENATYQPRLARHLGELRADLRLILAVATATAAASGEIAGKTVKLRDGDRLQITRLEGARIHGKDHGREREIAWMDLSIDAAGQLAEAAGVDPKTRLGIAALGYRQGEPEAAEDYLVRLLRQDTGLLAPASKLISRGRGEFVDDQGYTLVAGKFVAERFVRVEKLARQMASQLSRLGRMTVVERDKALGQIRAAGADGIDDAIVLVLKDQLETLADKLGRSSLPNALAKLAVKREALDAVRKHARDLIYDTSTYFYPYKPPAVSGARYSEYSKVQKEVDIRVAALRKLWDDKVRVPVGVKLRRDIELLLWTENQLGLMGEVSDRVLSHLDWIHTVAPVDALTLQNFCRTAGEMQAFVEHQRILAFNASRIEKLNVGEAQLVRVTNAYRMMFGHRPLAINLKLHQAAQGHGEEMSRLGYFSHTSPTKERRTPFRRMKLVGYDYGVSENIALGGSAEGAHVRWCHSSGHHRNLLNPSHTEAGMGNCGNYWVQNFGRGRSFER